MYRNLIGLVAVFAAALVLVGITFSSVKEERADFVFVNGSEPKTLDPQKMTGVLESRLAEALFEGLTYRNGVSQLPERGAAMAWDVAPDGRRYVFHMRPEARWTDGTPVTANDFVFAWKRLQEPEIASEYAYLLHGIRHAEAYNTFAAQVKALRGDPKAEKSAEREGLIAGLRALVGTPARPLDAKAWQGFVADRTLRDVVIRPVDPVLITGLDRDSGVFTPEEAEALVRALEGDAARREHDLAEAKAHFGVDQGVFAPDAATFVVELVAFVPYFLELTSFHSALPVPRHVVAAHPEDWFRPEHIVSNGPFRMQRWEINRKIRLAKSDTYWGAKDVRLGTVDALPIENNTTALNLYLTDEADWLPATYPPDLVDRLSKRPDFRASQGAATYFYRINCTRKPFDDPRIRLALSKAVDRATLVRDVTKKDEPPALTIAAPGVPGYEPPDSKMGFDLVAARRLLAEAGYGPGGKTLKFGVLYNTHEGHKKVAEAIADQWRRGLGVEATAYNAEWQSYLRNQTTLDYDVCRAGWVADYRDPNTFLDLWITKGGNNNTGWGDPTYDRLVKAASEPMVFAAEPDALLARVKEPEKTRALVEKVRAAPEGEARLAAAAALRFQLLREAEAILVQDAFPVIPIYFYINTNMISPRVEGFRTTLTLPGGADVPNLMDLHPLRDLSIRGAAR